MNINFRVIPEQTSFLTMKALLTIFIACSLLNAAAQGTVVFNNIHDGIVNAPIYQSDAMTKLSGPQYMAELLAGPSASDLTHIATTSFLTGAEAGYF